MTTAQVFRMAGTENKLLNHIKSRKLRYFGHMMRQPHDNVEGSVMVGLIEGVRNEKPWKTMNVLVGQHLPVDWSIG